MDELLRKYTSVAVEAARMGQKEPTGFYQVEETIPTYDNALFCLALFKTKSQKEVHEAETLLDRLLYFQNQHYDVSPHGSFPIFLHEYPFCSDSFLALRLAAVFFLIYRQFHSILNPSLKDRLRNALLLLYRRSHTLPLEIATLPFWVKVFILCFSLAMKQEGLQNQEGNEQQQLGQLFSHWSQERYSSDPKNMELILQALTLITPAPLELPYKEFLNWLQMSFHTALCCYVGPWLQVMIRARRAEISLYDYFLNAFLRSAPSSLLVPKRSALQAVLVPPLSDLISPSSYPSSFQGQQGDFSFAIEKREPYSICIVKPLPHTAPTHRFSPYVLLTASASLSLMLYRCTIEELSINRIVLAYESPTEGVTGKGEPIFGFFVLADSASITLDGKTATTFEVGDKIDLLLGTIKVRLAIRLLRGEGMFLGHVHRKKHPLTQENGAPTSDLFIFVREVRGVSSVLFECVVESIIE